MEMTRRLDEDDARKASERADVPGRRGEVDDDEGVDWDGTRRREHVAALINESIAKHAALLSKLE
ncbi:hypothetical protein ACFXNW_02730 [Nocardia sp. NPDC059180]|uniref:hypothetical protein n=1 Tax=Nocardia sp. NPDC059180 TaxID=3346761 RepID=UPI0036B9564E